jgi:small subunit ribosomal protein S20
MANIKSQMKRNRQNEKARMRNKAVRSEMKTRVKQTLQAIEDPSADAAESFRLAQKRIDEAVSKGVLNKNTAARKKARLAKRVNAS